MKVLFLTHWYPSPERPQKGVFIKEQAKALAKVGADLTVLHIDISSGGGFINTSWEERQEDGFRTARIRITGWLWKLAYTVYPIQLMLIRRAIDRIGMDLYQFDLIHSHVVHPAGAIGNRMADEHGLPHFISEHWSNLKFYFSKNPYRRWGRNAYDKAERIFVVSEFLKEQTAKFVTDPKKLAVIPNVVPAEEFNYRPAAIGSSYYLVMAARWNKGKRIIKRPKLLIKAVSEAAGELDRPITLSIIGDGDRIPEMKRFCAENHVHAQFHGFISKEQMACQFQKADLFLHGSEYETFSVVIAEALKCGTPVVASNVCAIPELISESNGLLVENKITPWKNGIIRALNHGYDRAAIAAAFKTRFGYKEVGNKLLESYEEALG